MIETWPQLVTLRASLFQPGIIVPQEHGDFILTTDGCWLWVLGQKVLTSQMVDKSLLWLWIPGVPG
jgi:hypothetical protein